MNEQATICNFNAIEMLRDTLFVVSYKLYCVAEYLVRVMKYIISRNFSSMVWYKLYGVVDIFRP